MTYIQGMWYLKIIGNDSNSNQFDAKITPSLKSTFFHSHDFLTFFLARTLFSGSNSITLHPRENYFQIYSYSDLLTLNISDYLAQYRYGTLKFLRNF